MGSDGGGSGGGGGGGGSRRLRVAVVVLVVALSSTATDGFVKSSAGHKLWYRIANPASFDAAPPLVVCHGGPQVPSDYLFDLENLEDRAVIFYDQLGCGRSDRPAPFSTASCA